MTSVFFICALFVCIRVFREIQEISKNDFVFREEQEPIDYVESLCETLQVYMTCTGVHTYVQYYLYLRMRNMRMATC